MDRTFSDTELNCCECAGARVTVYWLLLCARYFALGYYPRVEIGAQKYDCFRTRTKTIWAATFAVRPSKKLLRHPEICSRLR